MPYKLRMHHIDVGQGDASLIILKNDREIEKAILIDAGGSLRRSENPMLSRRVASFCAQKLRAIEGERAEKKLDAIVVSHFDTDHLGGFRYFEEYSELWGMFMTTDTKILTPIDTVAKQERLTAFAEEFEIEVDAREEPGFDLFALLGLENESIRMTCLAANCLINTGAESFATIKGNSRDGTPANRISLAFLIEFYNFRYYTGGDIGASQEEAFSEYIAYLNAFKVSHHAAPTSTPATFVDKCMPNTSSIISYGDNIHRHPHDEVVDRLLINENIAKIYFTGQLDEYCLNALLHKTVTEMGCAVIGEDELNIIKKLKIDESEEFIMIAPGVVTIVIQEGQDCYYVNYDRFDKEAIIEKQETIWDYPLDESYPRNGLYEVFLMIIQQDLGGLDIAKAEQRKLALTVSYNVIDAVNSDTVDTLEKLGEFILTHEITSTWGPDEQKLATLRSQARLAQLHALQVRERKTRGAFTFAGGVSFINKMTDIHEVSIPL